MKKLSRAYSLRRRFNLFVNRWHRRIGMVAALFLGWMAISGFLLNHTGYFDLSHRYVTSDFIAAHYGLSRDIPTQEFTAAGHWLVASGDVVIFDNKKIALSLTQPLGMVAKDNMLFIADATELVLIDANGDLIDKVSAPFVIDRIGLGCGGVVIAGAGKQMVTRDGASFNECSDNSQWAKAETLTALQRTKLASLFRPGVELERVLLDLHSGRFWGAWGVYFVDVLGFGLIALALTGIWLYIRHRKHRPVQR